MVRVLAVMVVLLALAACGGGTADPQSDAEAGVTAEEAAPDGGDEPQDGVAGDGEAEGDGPPDEPGPGQGLTVAAPLFALSWMAEQLAPAAEVHFLLAGGGDPHDLELSPSERELLETADVVAYAGDLDFMPQFESAVAGVGGEVVSLAEVAGEVHEGGDRGDDSHEGGGGIDPHLWFDAGVMADAATEMGDALAAADPEHAGAFEAAASDLATQLDDLSRQIDARLSNCDQDTVIVSHEAYGYLLEPRGIGQQGISGAGGHAEASPQRLSELTEHITAEGIPAIAAEPLHGRADAEALAAEAGVEIVEINPLEDVSDDEYARGYPAMLLEQVDAFATALGCEGRR